MLSRILRRFSIEHLWCLVTLAGIFVFTSTHPIRPHDFWWHARIGGEIVTTGQIPSTDSLSFTATGQPYIYRVWLAEVALYLLYTAGGPAAVVFAHSLSITAAYSLLLLVCQRLARSWRIAAFCTLFAAVLGLNDWNVRPQAISFLLGALCLWAMYTYMLQGERATTGGRLYERATTGGRPYLVFPLCMLVWVNSHGSFAIGLLLAGLWLLDSAWQALKAWWQAGSWSQARHLLAPGAAVGLSVLACLANPQGTAILFYPASLSSNSLVQNLIPEWAPPSFDSLHGSLFLVGTLLSASVLALSPRRPTLLQLATFLSIATFGLSTLRGAVWFGIVMAPVLADHLPALAGQVQQILRLPPSKPDSAPAARQLVLNTLLAALVLAGVALSLPWFKHMLPLPPDKAGLVSRETPVEATRFLLQTRPPRQLFHDQAYGSYLIWAAQPQYPVFVDLRIDLYPAQVWLDYLHIAGAGCDWEGLLERYGVNTLMLSLKEQAALVEAAGQSPDWQVIYQDTQTVILVRKTQSEQDTD